MKKTLRFLASLMLCCMLFSPLTISARSYTVSGTDMTLEFDESLWYVFTRDNLQGNPELAELGLDYDMFYSNMLDQDIYTDACLFYDDGDYIELLVIVGKDDNYVNLSNYSDSRAMVMGKATFGSFAKDDNLEIYENDYKYIVIEYFDANVYLCQYLTIINGYAYSFQFQSPYAFTDEKREIAREVMDDVTFAVDASMKEKNVFLDALFSGIVMRVAVGAALAVVVGIIIGIVVAVKRSKKKKAQNDVPTPINPPETVSPANPADSENPEIPENPEKTADPEASADDTPNT